MADQQPGTPAPDSGGRRNDIIAASLAAIVVLFAATNSRSTKITWIVGSSRAPLFVVIAICVAVGFAAGYLTARRHAKRAPSDN